MQFRELTPSDFEDVFKVAVNDFYSGSTTYFFKKSDFFFRTYEQLKLVMGSSHKVAIGIEERNQLVGAAIGYGDLSSEIFYPAFLWVAESRRNQRHGQTLAELLYANATRLGFSKFIVEVPNGNIQTKKIMKHLGFYPSRTVWTLVEKAR